MSSRRHARSIARSTSALALAVPEVIGHRMMRMWLAGTSPSARDRREFHLMGAEKAAAFQQSWLAMSMEAWRMALRFWWSPLSWQRNVGPAMMSRGLAPIRRRATANAARLRRAAR